MSECKETSGTSDIDGEDNSSFELFEVDELLVEALGFQIGERSHRLHIMLAHLPFVVT